MHAIIERQPEPMDRAEGLSTMRKGAIAPKVPSTQHSVVAESKASERTGQPGSVRGGSTTGVSVDAPIAWDRYRQVSAGALRRLTTSGHAGPCWLPAGSRRPGGEAGYNTGRSITGAMLVLCTVVVGMMMV